MSNKNELQDTENESEWISWIEDAIDKEYLKYYEYKNFTNIQEIGIGGFGKVFRANWKNNLEQYLVLKSFLNFNNITVKEIVNEVIMNIMYVMYPALFLIQLYINNLA